MQPAPDSATGRTAAAGASRPSERFSRAQRLRRAHDFDEIRRRGRRAEAGAFTLRLLVRSEGPRRLGVIASRKAGPSVDRNYAKRLLREFFRRNATLLPPSCDVVAVIRPGFRDISHENLRERFLHAIRQTSGKS